MQFHQKVHRPKICFICDTFFPEDDDLFEHIMYSHELDDPFVCKKYLISLIMYFDSMLVKFYACRCDKVFTNEKNYENHLTLHNAVRQFRCEYCPKKYMYKQMLMTHIVSVFNLVKPITILFNG